MNQIGVGTFTVSPLMRRYVNNVLDSGRISYGDYSRRFESEFARLHESRFGILSNSGTSSLQVALQALKELRGWHDGDEVIVPAATFVATVNIVLHNRMRPVLVDVDPDYYELPPELIEAAITPRTRAIIPVHVYGQPCDMTAIKAIADKYELAVIEDSCECMFARHEGRSAGAWGEIGCFSTYVAHLISTGVGGLALTNDESLAVKMRSLVNHGRDGIYISIDDDDVLTGGSMSEIISRRFRFESTGHSYRITELEAAIGLAQLENWQEMIDLRRSNAAYLTYQLKGMQDRIQLPKVRPHTEHSWMMYPLVLRDEPKRHVCEYLETRGIETREMLPLTNQPCYRGMFDESEYPIADRINRNGFYVGIHQDLSREELDYIAEVMEGALMTTTLAAAAE